MSSPKETFSVATTVEDPMSADALVDALQEKSIDGFVRARGAGGSDMLGAATTAGVGYYEILVPTPALEEAGKIIDAELAELEAQAGANERAAEEEALSGETQLPESEK
jgi:hypothetical protein